jgi:hypothetical protein
LRSPANRLQPAETFFDALPFPLADLVSPVPRGARVAREPISRFEHSELLLLCCAAPSTRENQSSTCGQLLVGFGKPFFAILASLRVKHGRFQYAAKHR